MSANLKIIESGNKFGIMTLNPKVYPSNFTSSQIQESFNLSRDALGAAIGHSVADCPVLIAYDKRKKVVAISHCGAKEINRCLPISTIDALSKAYNSCDNDIYAYISSSASKENYLYDGYPNWAILDEVWKNRIKAINNNRYSIDLKGAICDQLIKRNINYENISASVIDTISDNNFYSNYGEWLGNEEKKGRQYTGAVFVKKR